MSENNNSTVQTPQVIEDADAKRPTTQEEQDKQEAFDDFSQLKNESGVNMRVKVYSPSRTYFAGLAFSVTAVNDTGEFDVLPKHHPFICLLDACEMVVRSVSEGSRTISISGGLMHVKEDKIIVFLDI